MNFKQCYDKIDDISYKIGGLDKEAQLSISLEILKNVTQNAIVCAKNKIEERNPGMWQIVRNELLESCPDFNITYETLTRLRSFVKYYIMSLEEFIDSLDRFQDIFEEYSAELDIRTSLH